MKKLIILDLDGTLADTLEAITTSLNLTMDHYGFPRHTYARTKEMIGHGAKNLVRVACPEGTFDNDENGEYFGEVYKNYSKMYAKTYLDTDRCYDGIEDALTSVAKSGAILAVLSNKPDEFTKGIVKQILPASLISHVQGQTSLPVKPDPTAAIMIAEKFGVSPCDCAFVGDSDVDVQTAKNAGMYAVACSWGYRPRETLEGADFVIDSPAELMEIFK